jgi:deoxyribose-phosphate aldolase
MAPMDPTSLGRADVAAMLDHTLLKPEATSADVAVLCEEAARLGVAAVCVSPSMLPLPEPPGAGVAVATVIGFPSGAHRPEVKAAEAELAAGSGAGELDMVICLGAARAGDWAAVAADIGAVRRATPEPVLLKVIIESAALDDDEIVAACTAAEAAGADYVKTSTGFHPSGGASEHAVRLMADAVGGRLGVKASGGIRDAGTALAMIGAGATRLGCSASAAILDGIPLA